MLVVGSPATSVRQQGNHHAQRLDHEHPIWGWFRSQTVSGGCYGLLRLLLGHLLRGDLQSGHLQIGNLRSGHLQYWAVALEGHCVLYSGSLIGDESSCYLLSLVALVYPQR